MEVPLWASVAKKTGLPQLLKKEFDISLGGTGCQLYNPIQL